MAQVSIHLLHCEDSVIDILTGITRQRCLKKNQKPNKPKPNNPKGGSQYLVNRNFEEGGGKTPPKNKTIKIPNQIKPQKTHKGKPQERHFTIWTKLNYTFENKNKYNLIKNPNKPNPQKSNQMPKATPPKIPSALACFGRRTTMVIQI